MPSTSLLMSYTECPGGRLTTPPIMPFVLFLCNFITTFKMFCFNLVPFAPIFSLDILFLNPAFKNSPPHLHNPEEHNPFPEQPKEHLFCGSAFDACLYIIRVKLVLSTTLCHKCG